MKSDEGMLDKIVSNLVSNAIRYNNDGGVLYVSVAVFAGSAILTVRDEGIGIAQEDQKQVFEEFYRTTAAREKTTLGTGLGLPIVKRFTEQLGGGITLSSQLDEGTTMTVTLPQSGPVRIAEREAEE